MDYKKELEKRTLYYDIMNLWLFETLQGNSIIPYMRENGYKRIIVYGVKGLGERLIQVLKNSDLELICVIDINKRMLGDFKLLTPDDEIPDADLVIVSAEYYFDDIYKKMITRVSCPIVSITQLFTAAFKCRF